jgi:hypothetical protein
MSGLAPRAQGEISHTPTVRGKASAGSALVRNRLRELAARRTGRLRCPYPRRMSMAVVSAALAGPAGFHGQLPADSRAPNLRILRFSAVADAQLRPNMREYVTVHGCVRALMSAAVAVMVAVGDTSGPSAPEAGSRCRPAAVRATAISAVEAGCPSVTYSCWDSSLPPNHCQDALDGTAPSFGRVGGVPHLPAPTAVPMGHWSPSDSQVRRWQITGL